MRKVFLILLVAAPLVAAVDFTLKKATDLKLPTFDESGRLLRRLTSDSVAGSFQTPHLEKGQVEFFAPESKDQAVAVLNFEQADYTAAEEKISGDGAIQLVTPDGAVSGQGYVCLVKLGQLNLRTKVKFVSARFELTGDQGEVRFDPKEHDRDRLIRDLLVTGAVTLKRTATTKAPFDRAETNSARYSAEQRKIFMKTPVTLWNKGQKTPVDSSLEFFEFDVLDQPPPAPAPR